MYHPSVSNYDFQKENSPPSPMPTAPPYPPPGPMLASEEPTVVPMLFQGANINTTSNSNVNSPNSWSTGLCDCCHDINNCCLTCWCPCITFGIIAEMADRGSTSCGVSGALYTLILCLTGCSCLYSCFYRSKLRGQFLLKESPCTDCCVHCCCEQCALCQEYRELKNRGFDLSIGWQGNVERQKRLAAMAPAVEKGMTR